jgi:hypothetical protein
METNGEPLPEGDKFTGIDAATEDDEWTVQVAV